VVLALIALIGTPFALALQDAAAPAVVIALFVILLAVVLAMARQIARLQRRRAGEAHRWLHRIPPRWAARRDGPDR
jgi:uncharacterized membrane protein YbhN (UPF0104 family)